MKADLQLTAGYALRAACWECFLFHFTDTKAEATVEVTSTAAGIQCIGVCNAWNRLFYETVQMDSNNTTYLLKGGSVSTDIEQHCAEQKKKGESYRTNTTRGSGTKAVPSQFSGTR